MMRQILSLLADMLRCPECEARRAEVTVLTEALRDAEELAAKRGRWLTAMLSRYRKAADRRDRYKRKWQECLDALKGEAAEIERVRELVTEALSRRMKGSPWGVIDPLLREILRPKGGGQDE